MSDPDKESPLVPASNDTYEIYKPIEVEPPGSQIVVIKDHSPPSERLYQLTLDYVDFWPVHEPQFQVSTTIDRFAGRVLTKANIVQEGEELLQPDSFVFIALPLQKDARPGIEREYIPCVSRARMGGSGPALANIIQKDLEQALAALEKSGFEWRWVTVEAPENPDPGVRNLLEQHFVRWQRGEGLSYIAIKPPSKTTPLPQISPPK